MAFPSSLPQPVPDRGAARWLAGPVEPGRSVLAVLGVPTFRTSGRPRHPGTPAEPSGTHKTPAAVRRALTGFSTYSTALGLDLAHPDTGVQALDLGDVEDPDDPSEGPWRISTRVSASTAALTVVVGGDDAATGPAALGTLGNRVLAGGVVLVDSRLDLRTGQGSGTGLRQLLSSGLAGDRVAVLGELGWADTRADSLEAHARGVTRFAPSELEPALAVAGAKGGPVHVSLDLAAGAQQAVPSALGTQPHGLAVVDLLRLARQAGEHPQVSGVDLVGVDVTRSHGQEGADLLAACLLELAAGLARRRD